MAATPKLVQECARLLQGKEFSEARAAELAIEVERLNGDVRRAAATLGFDDEPATFLAVLNKRR
jgi:hypothetical protein